MRLHKTRGVGYVTAALFFAVAASGPAQSEDRALCPDLLYLIEQSQARFSAIRKDAESQHGGHEAALTLAGASYCAILEDAEKASYRCAWTFPQGDERARTTFQRLGDEMRGCIGGLAEEQTDRSVNHPDFYASHYYLLPGSRASVTIKDKSALRSTLVSIRIDARSGTD